MSDHRQMSEREASIPAELIERAKYDPVLHMALTMFVRGDLTLEQAVIKAALVLSSMVEEGRKALVDHINTCTCRHRTILDSAGQIGRLPQ